MSEETPRHIPDPRSFEERVFARFDALDARLRRLEEESERRAVETKPIWERALAEILEVRQDIGEIKEILKKLAKKVNVHSLDITELRAELSDHDDRLDKLEEAEPTR